MDTDTVFALCLFLAVFLIVIIDAIVTHIVINHK